MPYLMQGETAFLFFFHGAASRPCGPPALWVEVPLKAAAGRATMVKFQTINTSNVLSKTGKKI